MKCAIRAERLTRVSGIDVGPDGVITDETPEILQFIAMGWIQRMDVAVDAEVTQPETKVRRRR